ncbi:hypothetical protein BCR37DRAFT_388752 [Protomyces lactucae-debilis]|uniref:Uncharacterized protein n=1 Tax=Protomyces lactucae-debilis TaxID=2754530 RepID=A0A1Y2F3Y7_PROLT|nr:uncharacterized protein BCR37DRAFT_388752 [Protomyces lactucae-debilis]ORY78563.1 hypothetical protein BCR37DRAFT_388752 [Protomyces lactucae-debilis]
MLQSHQSHSKESKIRVVPGAKFSIDEFPGIVGSPDPLSSAVPEFLQDVTNDEGHEVFPAPLLGSPLPVVSSPSPGYVAGSPPEEVFVAEDASISHAARQTAWYPETARASPPLIEAPSPVTHSRPQSTYSSPVPEVMQPVVQPWSIFDTVDCDSLIEPLLPEVADSEVLEAIDAAEPIDLLADTSVDASFQSAAVWDSDWDEISISSDVNNQDAGNVLSPHDDEVTDDDLSVEDVVLDVRETVMGPPASAAAPRITRSSKSTLGGQIASDRGGVRVEPQSHQRMESMLSSMPPEPMRLFLAEVVFRHCVDGDDDAVNHFNDNISVVLYLSWASSLVG